MDRGRPWPHRGRWETRPGRAADRRSDRSRGPRPGGVSGIDGSAPMLDAADAPRSPRGRPPPPRSCSPRRTRPPAPWPTAPRPAPGLRRDRLDDGGITDMWEGIVGRPAPDALVSIHPGRPETVVRADAIVASDGRTDARSAARCGDGMTVAKDDPMPRAPGPPGGTWTSRRSSKGAPAPCMAASPGRTTCVRSIPARPWGPRVAPWRTTMRRWSIPARSRAARTSWRATRGCGRSPRAGSRSGGHRPVGGRALALRRRHRPGPHNRRGRGRCPPDRCRPDRGHRRRRDPARGRRAGREPCRRLRHGGPRRAGPRRRPADRRPGHDPRGASACSWSGGGMRPSPPGSAHAGR